MGLLDTLFGSAPSISYKQKFGTSDVLSNANQLIQGTGGFLQQAGKSALGQAASFGPGIQGGIPDAVARAQQGALLQYLNQSRGILNEGTDTLTNPGSAGLIPSFLGDLSKGVATSLGAKLLGNNVGAESIFNGPNGEFDQARFDAFKGILGSVGEFAARSILGDRVVDAIHKYSTNRANANTFNAPRKSYNYSGGSGIGGFLGGGLSEDRGGSFSGFGSGGADPSNEDRGGSYF